MQGRSKIDPKIIKFARKQDGGAFWNARRTFDEQRLNETKSSIREDGLLQDITVRKVDDTYQLICGERRLRSILSLIQENIDCYDKATGNRVPAVELYKSLECNVEFDCDDRRAARLSVAENLKRDNVGDFDMMIYCQDLVNLKDAHGNPLYSRREVADIIGRSDSWVSQTLSLFALPERAKGLVANGILKRSTALVMLQWNPERVDAILDVLDIMNKEEEDQEREQIDNEIAVLQDELETAVAAEELSKKASIDSTQASKSKTMLAKRLAEAKEKRTRTRAKITPARLQAAADRIPNGRIGKNRCLTHKVIREMRNELLEANLQEIEGRAIDGLHVMLITSTLSIVLGESEDRHPIQLLERLYKNLA